MEASIGLLNSRHYWDKLYFSFIDIGHLELSDNEILNSFAVERVVQGFGKHWILLAPLLCYQQGVFFLQESGFPMIQAYGNLTDYSAKLVELEIITHLYASKSPLSFAK